MAGPVLLLLDNFEHVLDAAVFVAASGFAPAEDCGYQPGGLCEFTGSTSFRCHPCGSGDDSKAW